MFSHFRRSPSGGEWKGRREYKRQKTTTTALTWGEALRNGRPVRRKRRYRTERVIHPFCFESYAPTQIYIYIQVCIFVYRHTCMCGVRNTTTATGVLARADRPAAVGIANGGAQRRRVDDRLANSSSQRARNKSHLPPSTGGFVGNSPPTTTTTPPPRLPCVRGKPFFRRSTKRNDLEKRRRSPVDEYTAGPGDVNRPKF